MTEKNWKAKASERYQELKKQGKSFFPYIIAKDTLAVLIVFAAVSFLAFKFGAGLDEIADPTDTTYNPRPEWYFLFLFQSLKLFPGSLEAVAAVILPTVGILFLLLLPFVDRGPKRHPLDRPLLASLAAAVLGGVVFLTYLGWKSPLLNPVIEKDPQVLAGRQLFNDLRCFYCHSIQGKGGSVGPELTLEGAKRDHDWLARHFQDPQKVSKGSVMPKLNLLPEEVENLVAYLESLGGGAGPYSAAAPKLFEDNCVVCHRLDGKGGDVGPDLSAIRSYRDKGYVKMIIRDPKKINPDAVMSGFRDSLTEPQIEDLARYLLSSQRK